MRGRPIKYLTVGGLFDDPHGGLHFFPHPSRAFGRLKQVDSLAQPQDLMVRVAELKTHRSAAASEEQGGGGGAYSLRCGGGGQHLRKLNGELRHHDIAISRYHDITTPRHHDIVVCLGDGMANSVTLSFFARSMCMLRVTYKSTPREEPQ